MSLASGHTSKALEGEELARQMRDWSGYPLGLIRLSPGGWVFPPAYLKFANNIYNFKYAPSDVMVMTYPKAGTTWMQEIAWTMLNNPNLDHPMAVLPVMDRSPFQEDMLIDAHSTDPDLNPFAQSFNLLCPGQNPEDGVMLQMAQAIPEPRLIKSHLPFSLHPKDLLDKIKVIYVSRNPKDLLVSYHHHCQLIHTHGYRGTFEEFVKYFVEDDLVYGPYWLHVKEAWEKRHHPNLHFVFYEDLKANIMGELNKINTFLNTNLNDQQLQNVRHHTSFKEMKARDAHIRGKETEVRIFNQELIKKDGGFFRKGETGGWKGTLTPELEAKVDKWMELHMAELGITFKYSV